MQNNNPLFAPAGGINAIQDDLDLNEIFSEYFINELHDDPLNAYTSSMANFSGGVQIAETNSSAPVSSTSGVNLPTGGIRTVFHGAQQAAQSATLQPAQVAAGIVSEPESKKPRIDAPRGLVQKPTGGITLPMGMFNHPGMPTAMQAHQQAVARANAPETMPQSASTTPATVGMVTLPVGVGIRLGCVGGVAPATAQSAPRSGNAVQNQFNVWGAHTQVGVSDQAVAERRQRNREHAKRSRVRKKFMLESLQEEVRALQKENQQLRMLVQEHIPHDAMKIISECCTSNPLFTQGEDGLPAPPPADKNPEVASNLERADFALMHSLTSGQQCFVLSDPKLPDNPIVFASPGFYKLTGYNSQEVLGRNCRFLQGPGTDAKAVEVIRKAVATGSDATVCLLNYKSDGTPFWNQFFMAALRDSDNCIVNYVGVQTEVEPQTGATALEDKVNAVLPLQNKEE